MVEGGGVAPSHQPERLLVPRHSPHTRPAVQAEREVQLVSPDCRAVVVPPALSRAHVIVPVLPPAHQDRPQRGAPPGEGVVESVGEVRQVPVQRSLLCPDLNVPPPLDVEVLAVAAPEEESPGLDTVLAVRSRAEGALYQTVRTPAGHQVHHTGPWVSDGDWELIRKIITKFGFLIFLIFITLTPFLNTINTVALSIAAQLPTDFHPKLEITFYSTK